MYFSTFVKKFLNMSAMYEGKYEGSSSELFSIQQYLKFLLEFLVKASCSIMQSTCSLILFCYANVLFPEQEKYVTTKK